MSTEGNVNPQGDGQGQGGGGDLGWRAQLKEDLKANDFFTRFDSVTSLGKYAMETDGKLKSALFIPGDNATEEERNTFYNRLGRPEAPDKYDLAKPDGYDKEGLTYNENLEKGFRDFAYKMGLSVNQAKSLYNWYNGVVVEEAKNEMSSREKRRTEVEKILQSEWKDKYDENVQLTKRAVVEFGGEDFQKILDDTGLGNHPVFIRVFHNIGRAMMEDKFISGKPAGGGDKKTAGDGRLSYPSMQKK